MAVKTNNPTDKQASTPIAQTVLDNLAARIRGSGLYFMLLRPDGSVAYNDSVAGLFFQRYVLPQLQYPEPGDNGWIAAAKSLTAGSTMVISNSIPGVVLAMCPYIERR